MWLDYGFCEGFNGLKQLDLLRFLFLFFFFPSQIQIQTQLKLNSNSDQFGNAKTTHFPTILQPLMNFKCHNKSELAHTQQPIIEL